MDSSYLATASVVLGCWCSMRCHRMQGQVVCCCQLDKISATCSHIEFDLFVCAELLLYPNSLGLLLSTVLLFQVSLCVLLRYAW